jgi:hypothetical protein
VLKEVKINDGASTDSLSGCKLRLGQKLLRLAIEFLVKLEYLGQFLISNLS